MGQEADRAAPGAVRALLVEDNPFSQDIGQRLLAKLGCHVDVASSGLEAVDLTGRNPYDIVFLDCELPAMDGFQTAAELRRRENGGPRRPIVGVTGHSTPEDRERCLAAGMDDYLAKPVSLEAFRQQLARWTGAVPADSGGAAPERDDDGTLDRARLRALARLPGGQEAVARLAERLFECATADLVRIRAAVEQQDAGQLREAAHGLRGACLNMGVVALAGVLEQIEHLAAEGDLVTSAPLVAGLDERLAQARESVKQFLARV